MDPARASVARRRLCRLLVDDDLRTKYSIYEQFSMCNYRIIQCHIHSPGFKMYNEFILSHKLLINYAFLIHQTYIVTSGPKK